MMRRLMILVAVMAVGFATVAKAGDAAKGKEVFNSATPKCSGCHTEAKNPLAKVGASNTEADLKAWVRTPKEQMAKNKKTGMMPAYPAAKISDADLDNLVAYLATMK